MLEEDVRAEVKQDFELLQETSSSMVKEIDLYMAIALAIQNNRELRVNIMQSALEQGQIDITKFDMMPKLAVNAGYKSLDKDPASTSVSMENNNSNPAALGDSPAYSVSQEKTTTTADAGFTWNALDFGLSYVRAGQQADRFLIAKELERKAIHNLTREVIYAYWKTLSADKLLEQINPLMDRVNAALDDYEHIEELLISSPMDALLYQKELLDVAQILLTQRRALMDARIELASLIGMMPDEEYVLVATSQPLTELDLDIKSQEEAALFSRPELMETRYQKRISAEEAKASMLALFPSLQFNATWTYDSNKYLLNKSNMEYGALFGVNLFNIFQASNIKEVNEVNEQMVDEQRLALTMTVLSQVHIANVNYAQSLREYSNAKHYLNVAQRINDLIANAQKISRFGELEVIREEASLLVAQLRNDIAFAEMQYSLGAMYSSVGMNFTPDNIGEMSNVELASLLENNLNRWTKKYTAYVTKPINKQNPVLSQTIALAENSLDLDPLEVGLTSDLLDFKFEFNKDTFYLTGSGKVRYDVSLSNGEPLPNWLTFLPSEYSFIGRPSEDVGSLEITIEASNDVASLSDTFTLVWEKNTSGRKSEEGSRDNFIINQELLDELNKTLEDQILNVKRPLQEINELQLDNLVAALKDNEAEKIDNTIEEIADSSFIVKPKPKPSKKIVIAALEDSLSDKISSLTSYSSSQSAYIQIGAFRKENVSVSIADDISNQIGTTVEVVPTLVSEPVMYRILVGPEHKDDIINTIADLMELGISDYFLTHG
jgi:outer membrane protein TolC